MAPVSSSLCRWRLRSGSCSHSPYTCRVFTLDPPSGSIFIAVAVIVALSIGLLTCWRKFSSALLANDTPLHQTGGVR